MHLQKILGNWFKQLNTDIKEINRRVQHLNKDANQNQKLRDEIEKEIKEVTGPFMTKFNKVSEQVGIRKQPYHGGSLIGPDVHKVLNNFEKFSDIFLPVQIDTTTGCMFIWLSRTVR